MLARAPPVTMQRVTSRHNPLIARYRAVSRGQTDGLLLLDGAHLVIEALNTRLTIREAAVAADALEDPDVRALIPRIEATGIEIIEVSRTVMQALSPVRSPSSIVAIAERPVHKPDRMYANGNPLVVIASEIQDPGNVGAIVRVAEAGGASGLVFTGASADPFGWKALRGSMGSALRFPLATEQRVDQAVAEARRHGCRVLATVPRGGRSLFELDLTKSTAALIGGEGSGVPAAFIEAADERVTIPMRPPVESLNTAVAAAVLVYEARRQRTG